MTLLEHARLLQDAQVARDEGGRGPLCAEWFEPFEFVREFECERGGRQFGVNVNGRLTISFGQMLARVLVQASAQLCDAFTPNDETCGLRVPAETREEIGASGQAVEQMIACDAARRTVPRAVFVKRDDDGGPTKFFRKLRRDEADDAAMPARACDHRDRAA